MTAGVTYMSTESVSSYAEQRRLRVFIIDDQPLMREALSVLFATLTRHLVVGATDNDVEVAGLILGVRTEVVIIDAGLPDGAAFDLGAKLLSRAVGLRLIYLDEEVVDTNLRLALELDAAGYLIKNESFQRVIWALQQVADDKPAYCQAVADRLIVDEHGYRLAGQHASPARQRLTPREFEVFEHLTRGLTVRQTARAMMLAESTVGNHKSSLMSKLDVHRQVDLVRLAVREGLVED